MEQEDLLTLLMILFDDTIDLDKAWKTYNNFINIFEDKDQDTIDYLLDVVDMDRKQRLVLRNRIAERGFELTPNELDQYIFILLMALYKYVGN
jgi:hypothetical protein|tara:strand:- start:9 stop:287 length:279 start_codon:yes stop_codon:yes gene_type:complete